MIEVFADVCCPFTHAGLCRLVERRHQLGADHVRLRVRAWPLELVNGAPLDGGLIAEEVAELRAQVTPELFGGFDERRFPSSSRPALALTAAAYRLGDGPGERVALALRRALFEEGRDIGEPAVLAEVASAEGVGLPKVADEEHVLADWAEGRERGVIGSPHFFAAGQGWFCPSLDIERVDGHLRITADQAAFDAFVDRCLGG